MRVRGTCVALLAVGLMALPALALDNPQGPWGQAQGNLSATAQAPAPLNVKPLINGMEFAWEYDTLANALNRTNFQSSSIVFDAEGNIYWCSGGNIKLASMAPNGTLRWATALPGPAPTSSGTPVVGEDAVYTWRSGETVVAGAPDNDFDGDGQPGNVVGAYNKATGAPIWETEIDGVNFGQTLEGAPWPALYNGKLYITTRSASFGLQVTRLDAATGALDWRSVVDPTYTFAGAGGRTGQPVFVPNLFGAGEHGLFVQWSDGSNNTDPNAPANLRDVNGIKVTDTGATLMWQSPASNVSHPHLIYSSTTGLLYGITWWDQEVVFGKGGTGFHVYDPMDGSIIETLRTGNFGFCGTAALMYDNKSVIAGSSEGKWFIHQDDNGDGIIDAIPVFFNQNVWYSEPRHMCQLFPADANGGPYLLTGTSSDTLTDPNRTSRIVIYDMGEAVIPNTDDGPAYFDDLEVRVGPDVATALASTPILTETFESATDFPTVPGPVAQSPRWTNDSGVDASGAPTVMADPTPRASGKVLMLNPFGNKFLPSETWQATIGLPATIPDQITNYAVVLKWKQWRTDLTDNVAIETDLQDGVFQWDQIDNGCRRVYTDFGWATSACLTVGPSSPGAPQYGWDEIEVRYDYLFDAVELYVNGVVASGVPDNINLGSDPNYPFGLPMNEIFFAMYPSPPVADPMIPVQNPLTYYVAGGVGHVGQQHQRGGPLLGPDGKVYYFMQDNQKLIALKSTAPPLCLGDVNCDGKVDFKDIDPFVARLGCPGPASCDTGCPWQNADINSSGSVTFADIDPFVGTLGFICP